MASASLVVAAHAAFAWSFLADPQTALEASSSGALVIELAPIAVARADLPADIAPGPDQVQASASPEAASAQEEKPDAEPPAPEQKAKPMPELVRAPDPDPLPVPVEEKREAPVTAAPPPSEAALATTASQAEADRAAPVAAAPVRGVPTSAPSVELPRWTTRLQEQLERNKRYPAHALKSRTEGTAIVGFTIDRKGQLISMRLEGSSGSTALDEEALALLKRAAPLPPPPVELSGEQVSITVPIRFRMR
jgi:protein TonB